MGPNLGPGPKFSNIFGGAWGTSPCHLAHFMKFGPRPNFELFRKRFYLITRLSSDQWEGQPLTKNLRETHENLAKPLGSSSHVATNQFSLANFQILDPFWGVLFGVATAQLQQHNPLAATLTVAW